MIVTHAITLTQPWATLMVIGAKQFETRGRRTHFRGPVAIHASKELDTVSLSYYPEFSRALLAAGIEKPVELPLGALLGVVTLTDCISTEDAKAIIETSGRSDERVFGNYGPGRWAYLTKNPRRLREPIPARGFQMIPWKLLEPITEDMLA